MKNFRNIFVICCLISGLYSFAFSQDLKTIVEEGDLSKVKELLSGRKELINTPDENGSTPLIYASKKGHMEIVRYLLENSANVNAKNKSNISPLHYAANYGFKDIVQLLLDKGADINAESRIGTPVHRAIYRNHIDVLKLLVKNKANVNVLMMPRKWTPLHCTFGQKKEAAKILIENGAEIDAMDSQGKTPLFWAINSGNENLINIARMLIDKGADVNIVTSTDETPLLVACKKGHAEVVRLLLKNNAGTGTVEKTTNRTLLHLAAINGYGDIAGQLIKKGIDLNAVDNNNRNALYYAGKFGNKSVADILLENNAESDGYENNFGKSVYLNKKMDNNEAYVWKLKNRGWVIKTGKNLFVFNNEELGTKPDVPKLSNGYVSASELADQNVFAFYTTFHARPGKLEFIHALEDSIKNITYLHYKDDPWKGNKNVVYLKGYKTSRFGDVEITSYEKHEHYGMGYLGYYIKADGLKIYCSGYYPKEIDDYKEVIDKLAAQYGKCDIAFINTASNPARQKEYINYALKKLSPEIVFPSHVGRHNSIPEDVLSELFKDFNSIKIQFAENPGERFHYKDKKLIK